ncbi:hypothetical protein HanXRQr2_Chr05g0230461 [Helianthus annuus]|uniref:Uncharacterized protein n=1 Tax=Helianthus annuus TaxID=4232 RepID=A0A251UQZ3_HELAN|nr:hypothetical protein HanXRQr2_Chr05g0230461 [Helianthus annuus]
MSTYVPNFMIVHNQQREMGVLSNEDKETTKDLLQPRSFKTLYLHLNTLCYR